jgi:hypothetical protein
MRRSWVRDYLCPICAIAPIFVMSWWIFLVYLLSVAALTTYWDWMMDEDNYFLAGMGCGVAFLPLMLAGMSWEAISIRAVFLCLSWGIWCAINDNDFAEEYGRGFLFSFATIIFYFPS